MIKSYRNIKTLKSPQCHFPTRFDTLRVFIWGYLVSKSKVLKALYALCCTVSHFVTPYCMLVFSLGLFQACRRLAWTLLLWKPQCCGRWLVENIFMMYVLVEDHGIILVCFYMSIVSHTRHTGWVCVMPARN